MVHKVRRQSRLKRNNRYKTLDQIYGNPKRKKEEGQTSFRAFNAIRLLDDPELALEGAKSKKNGNGNKGRQNGKIEKNEFIGVESQMPEKPGNGNNGNKNGKLSENKFVNIDDYQKSRDLLDGANTLYIKGEIDASFEMCREAIKIYAGSGIAYNLLGKLYLKKKEPGKALKAFDNAISKKSNLPHVYVNKTKAYLALGRAKEAEDCLKSALNLFQEELSRDMYLKSEIISRIGRIYLEKKNYGSCLKYYGEAISCCPENMNLYKRRAIAYTDMGKHDLALDDVEYALGNGLKTVAVYLTGAIACHGKWLETGDSKWSDQVKQYTEPALALDPENFDVRLLLNIHSIRLGKFEEVIR